MQASKLIVILGPTASGKSKLAIKLAKIFNGEIVSADSRQVYKQMDIGTAKPSKKEIQCIPHYLIDIISPDEEFNVAIYKKLAIKKIKEIQKRGKLPFLVGGTGLYISAILNNISFLKVPPNKKLREKLEQKSAKELFTIYKKLDAGGAKFIEKDNKRRLVRAIEVCKITGKPFWKQRRKGKPLFDVLQLGIKVPKEELEKRISERVDKMIQRELEKEVKNLAKKYGFEIPPMQTIGYQEWQLYLKNIDDCLFTLPKKKKELIKKIKEEIKLHTQQFSKRQMTWFKRDKKIKWIKNYRQSKKMIEEFL